MKVLTLQLKREYFDQIVSGEKTEEYREIRPRNQAKYCDTNPDTDMVTAKHFDQIKFVTGQYKGKRPYIVVDVLSEEIGLLVDEDGNEINYFEDGEDCVACEVIFHLGKVVFNSEKE